ncbi:MAG: VanZ family protein [Flavobacteriaceae bacterium]|nr:VanZ family protein [Flavobacteriaceae bacterium]
MALACSVFILIFSLVPIKNAVLGSIENSDKILHTFSYAILSLSWLFYFNPQKKLRIKLLVAFSLFCYGIIIEVLQSTLTTYRTGSFNDVIANTIGIFIALITFKTLYKIIFSK